MGRAWGTTGGSFLNIGLFREVPMTRFSGLIALVAFLSFSTVSALAIAGGDKKEEKKDKGGHVVMLSDDKKDEKKDKGGHVVVFGDEKKDEKKGMGGK
jgi:hypothetical protein